MVKSLSNPMEERVFELFQSHPHISTDTRKITPESIFFALKGASFDGNKFAIAALAEGAVAAVIDDRSIYESAESERLILVDDVLTTLQSVARLHRRALNIPIVAISGSNGKTTTKELTAAVLSKRYKTKATVGNLNNHIGVPLTLLSMSKDVELGIVEMGASSCGEIELLSSIAEPNYGILTNVGRAHLDGFGGEMGVRKGKGELLDYLKESDGAAFIATENEVLNEMASERKELRVIPFSYQLANDLQHQLEGEYNRMNIAAAVAIGREFGVSDSDIAEAIANYTPRNNRSERMESDRNTLVIDCYNANPSSMELAIANFAQERFTRHSSKIMILGEMLELGEWSAAEHQRIVMQATESDAERIILVGECFVPLEIDDPRVEHYNSRTELEEALKENPIDNCSVLIKGSRGVGLERIFILL